MTLIVHTEASATTILSGSRLLMPDMPAPLLVVENVMLLPIPLQTD